MPQPPCRQYRHPTPGVLTSRDWLPLTSLGRHHDTPPCPHPQHYYKDHWLVAFGRLPHLTAGQGGDIYEGCCLRNGQKLPGFTIKFPPPAPRGAHMIISQKNTHQHPTLAPIPQFQTKSPFQSLKSGLIHQSTKKILSHPQVGVHLNFSKEKISASPCSPPTRLSMQNYVQFTK